MESIVFNDGYKEYTINGDETKVVRFNPSDINIIDRIGKALEQIEQIAEEMRTSDISLNPDGTATGDGVAAAGEMVSAFDRRIREQIDFVLGSPVCATALGEQSCLSMVGGKPLYERLLDAVLPIIQKDVESERAASQKRVKKYTKGIADHAGTATENP